MRILVGKSFLTGFFLNVFILSWSLICGASILFAFALIVWIDMMLYAYNKIEHRSPLFAFGVAFFVFLMGREFLKSFFGYKIEDFSTESNNHLYICLLVSLLFLFVFYIIFSRTTAAKQTEMRTEEKNLYTQYVRKIASIMFYCILPLSLAYEVIVGLFVSVNGYADYYSDYEVSLSNNVFLSLLSKADIILPLTVAIIMASLPTKREFKWPFRLYCLYLLLSLASGRRGTFILGLLQVFVFIVYMQGLYPEDEWFKRKYFLYLAAIVPVLAIAGSIINITRFGGSTEKMGLFEAFVAFFYDQGVTGNVVKRAFQYSDRIPDATYTLEFLHSGIVAKLLGIKVYNGNTIEHALYGNSMAHALGYIVLGKQYLLGRGTGSSYIIDLYYDYGYFGVAIGNIIYAWIFAKISNIRKSNIITRSLIFAIITKLLWAPRGSFSGFITLLGASSTIVSFLLVFGMSTLMMAKNKENANGQIYKVLRSKK